jgi:hypothetical protein
LNSLVKQANHLIKIIVVDNASTDNTTTIIKQKFPEVKIITLKENMGVTGGRNAGINYAENYDYILFFDHDMIADKNMISEMIKIGESAMDIGIVTPKIYFLENKKYIWSAGTGINLFTGQVYFRGGLDKGQYDKAEEVQVAPASLLVKKGVIDKIGGFDDIYFATYEDTDFCFRAKKAGYKTYYSPKAIAYHEIPIDSDESNKRLLQRTYWIGRNKVLFMKRWGSEISFIFCLPIYILYLLYLSIKANNIKAFKNFIAGTVSGLTKRDNYLHSYDQKF